MYIISQFLYDPTQPKITLLKTWIKTDKIAENPLNQPNLTQLNPQQYYIYLKSFKYYFLKIMIFLIFGGSVINFYHNLRS